VAWTSWSLQVFAVLTVYESGIPVEEAEAATYTISSKHPWLRLWISQQFFAQKPMEW
jgi:hypothetical protein